MNTEVAQLADGMDAVITGGYHIAPRSPDELMDFLAYDGRRLPIVTGHRGGPAPGLPENCLATFEVTLTQTFSMLEKGVNIIETDIPRELGQLLFAPDFVKPKLP